jgi:CelD/BcsL family acetyltransferase involved in cellulose biosynthesis
VNHKYIVKQENFESLISYRQNCGNKLEWKCLFVLPEWMKAWWKEFNSGIGGDNGPDIISVKRKEALIGLAPLQIRDGRASLIGNSDVCDYLDFIVAAGMEEEFFKVLLDHLAQQSTKCLDLGLLRPDSTVLSNLINVAKCQGCTVKTNSEDIALELDLPATWHDYLGQLKGKQRHEVKRKFRRLNEAGDINFRVIEGSKEIVDHMPTFFKLFELSSEEKATFLTDQMRSFFRTLAIAMADANLLKLYMLELKATPAAMSLCFDFNDKLHLYNSGFDPHFRALSVGLLCKVLSIKDAIERGRRRYDFLKGTEIYKYRLGGREVPLSSCRIEL